MVENIQPTQGPQMPQEPKKPIYSDVYTVQKTESDLDTLKLTLKTAKKIEKEEARSSVAQEDVEKSHEEEGVALHKKEKKKKKEVKSARQKKMEHLSSIRAVKEVDTKTDKQEGEESPLQDYDPNQLPPGLQKAYEQQMGSMQKFFQMLLQSGDPKIIALVQSWQKELANMHTPPTAADATQLNMMMQLMQNLISKLPPNVQSEFYQIEVQMYNQMKNDANSDIKNLTPQLAKLRDLINMEQKLVPILQQGAQAAEALAGGDPNYNDFLAMGSNILALEEMLESLPPNSPMRSEIQKALQAWGSITSSNPNFPPGMILGYSIFLAAMQQFASKGGTKKDLQQVWDRFSNFDTMGIPGLKQAIDFIQNKFPSPSMTPTDWSFSSDGHIIMNYEAFNQLISGGMAKALNNIGSVAKALEDEAAAASSQLSNDQTEQQQTQNLYNEASHDLGIFLQLLQKAEGHVKPAGPPGGNYVQKALDPLIRKEIEGYRMLIKILEQYLPGQDFSNIERLLDSVASHLPNVSEGDLKSLNGILGQLNKAAQGIPCKSFKASYWGAELDLFNTLSEIGSATTDNSGIIYQTIQDIENIMKRMEGGSFTAADMSQLVTDIETLMKNGQVLSYGDSNAISNFLESLSNVMGAGFGSATGSEANLYNVIILALQESLVQQYMQMAGKNATEKGLQQFINNFVGHLPNSGNPMLLRMETELEDLANCSGPHALYQLFKVGPDGKITADPKALNNMLSKFLAGGLHPVGGDPGGWMLLLNDLKDIEESFDPKNNGMAAFDEIMKDIARSVDVCWAMLWKVDSLQDLFRRVMLNKFMPEQEAELQRFAKSLKFNDDAGNMLSDLLKILTNLTQAKANYAFPPKNAEEKKEMEKNLAKDSEALSKAIDQIDEDLAALGRTNYGDDPTVIAAKKKLIQQLNDMRGNLQKAQQQIGQVERDLQTGSKDISVDLDALVNGDPNAQPPAYVGGLSQIITTANGASQDYASVSLTQEFSMQMIMSRVQQEWEITTSCMKSIHNAYMILAKAIYK